MRVTEDDLLRVHAQRGDHVVHRAQARASQRHARHLRLERAHAGAIQRPDGGGDPDARECAAAEVAAAVHAAPDLAREVHAQHLPGAAGALRECIGERVERRDGGLVVVGCARPLRHAPADARSGRDRDRLEARDGHVAVDVVAVRRVGAGTEPDARVGQLDICARHPLGDQARDRRCVRGRPLLEAQRLAGEAALVQPVADNAMVVVAAEDRDSAAAQRVAQLLEERQCYLEDAP